MLCNVYLHRLDRRRKTARDGGVLVRYADDLPVLCQTRQQADRALAALTGYLAELGLALKPAKTRIVHLTEGGEGFDFLGFHHRLVPARRSRRQVMFLARWPSRTAMQHARDRIRELTARSRLAVPVERVVQDLNAFLRGRSGYFRYGNSAGPFDAIRAHALHRLARFVPTATSGHRHLVGAGCAPVTLLHGSDQPQRKGRRSRAEPALAGEVEHRTMKDVGEPCAGEPHARFDGRALAGTGAGTCHRASALPNHDPPYSSPVSTR
jgi:Reverse transcriptase (RNA-dependent DNA polymerase)/Group II intron, maturase-specific domain